jgi:hypothetical protein
MVAASYFADAQAQFSESQKKFVELLEETQAQVIESQKKLINSWIGNLSDLPAQIDITENLEKALSFQRQLVDSSLSAQQTSAHLIIAAQKQFWDSYFQAAQNVKQNTSQG